MREIRPSGSMSGRGKRSRACGSEPRRGNPDTRTYRRLHYRATSRLYSCSTLYCISSSVASTTSCLLSLSVWPIVKPPRLIIDGFADPGVVGPRRPRRQRRNHDDAGEPPPTWTKHAGDARLVRKEPPRRNGAAHGRRISNIFGERNAVVKQIAVKIAEGLYYADGAAAAVDMGTNAVPGNG